MSAEALKAVFDWLAVVLVGLAFLAGAGALITGNILGDRQAARLKEFDKGLTQAKTDLAMQQERAAKAEGMIASAEQHASEASAKAEGFRLEIAEANESAARANEMAEQERLARVKIEERLGGWRLSEDAQGRVAEALRPFAGTHFSLTANPVEVDFLETIDRILTDSGWIRDAPVDDEGKPATIVLSNKALVASFSGLSVLVSEDQYAALSPTAAAYKQALVAEGFNVKLLKVVGPASKIAPGVVKIKIGKRE